MGNQTMISIIIGGVVLIGLLYLALGGGIDYPHTDMNEVDRGELFAAAEKLMAESADWEVQLEDGTVKVSSSVGPYPVRAIRYTMEVDAPLEAAVAYIHDEVYCGKGRRETADGFQETLYEDDSSEPPTEWVRRSVHLSPPPGGNRTAIVLYVEDRPDDETYRVAFKSVESRDGVDFPGLEDTVRFHVFPSIYKAQQIAPGKVRITKVEGVDPRGAMSPLLNNLIISKLFFRNFMFEQAKAMRDTVEAQG